MSKGMITADHMNKCSFSVSAISKTGITAQAGGLRPLPAQVLYPFNSINFHNLSCQPTITITFSIRMPRQAMPFKARNAP